MYFVGRKKEINQINKALVSGRNIVVYGKYGIGRTTLVRHVAAVTKVKWRFLFVDFSSTPVQVCRQLYNEFFPDKNVKKQSVGYKKMMWDIVNTKIWEHEKLILVLDNIEKITHQRIDFLHYLSLNTCFAFIGIVENSLPASDLLRLRAVLKLTCQIRLSNLKEKEVAEAIQFYSSKYQLDWSEKQIKNYSRMTRGYPLFLAEKIINMKTELENQITPKGECSYDTN